MIVTRVGKADCNLAREARQIVIEGPGCFAFGRFGYACVGIRALRIDYSAVYLDFEHGVLSALLSVEQAVIYHHSVHIGNVYCFFDIAAIILNVCTLAYARIAAGHSPRVGAAENSVLRGLVCGAPIENGAFPYLYSEGDCKVLCLFCVGRDGNDNRARIDEAELAFRNGDYRA